jgi:hypothetical protein
MCHVEWCGYLAYHAVSAPVHTCCSCQFLVTQVTELRATVAAQNSTIVTQSTTIQSLSNASARHTIALTTQSGVDAAQATALAAHTATLTNLTQTLQPFPVFDKLRVGNSVFNMYSAKLPVQKIQNTTHPSCTVGSDPLFLYGSDGGGSYCRFADTPYLSPQTATFTTDRPAPLDFRRSAVRRCNLQLTAHPSPTILSSASSILRGLWIAGMSPISSQISLVEAAISFNAELTAWRLWMRPCTLRPRSSERIRTTC